MRRETPVDQVIEEPAGSRDRLAISVDQAHRPDDSAIAFLDYPRNGLPEHAPGRPNDTTAPRYRRKRHPKVSR
ncbi:hypothetical protein O1M63_41340 [Streptomyces mirabilis]|uniref:hypothetical protein n=1 Tax=Streptomyces mirabilis TaxID=68239 RepID=UPI0022C9BFAE|nr:hypothetical protein [Streptomyces mirabilis]